MTTCKDIYDAIDAFAPFRLQQQGDNSGLLVGSGEEPVTCALLALDITSQVIDEAKAQGAQLIVSHHPIIFHPLKRLDGGVASRLYREGIGAICAHTNLDMAHGGISDRMAQLLGASVIGDFEVIHRFPFYKVTVFVPQTHTQAVYDAMARAGAGSYGLYEGCAFSAAGEGVFHPLRGAHPFIGSVGGIERVREDRLEMIAAHDKLAAVVDAMKAAHPYETVAYDIYETQSLSDVYGYGKVCEMDREYTLEEFAQKVRAVFGCTALRYTQGKDTVRRIALCSGAGGSNLRLAMEKGVDAYITGDVKHDVFVDAVNAGFTVMDAGHYHTEVIFWDILSERLEPLFPQVRFIRAESGADPVCYCMAKD